MVVPVRLTHEMIGRLVGAHRPSVTTALSELARSGRIARIPEGWLLRGDPPSAATVASPQPQAQPRGSRASLRAVDAMTALSLLPSLALLS